VLAAALCVSGGVGVVAVAVEVGVVVVVAGRVVVTALVVATRAVVVTAAAVVVAIAVVGGTALGPVASGSVLVGSATRRAEATPPHPSSASDVTSRARRSTDPR
jgi:hypothetical protein